MIISLIFAILATVLIVIVIIKSTSSKAKGGKILTVLAFLAFFIFPGLALYFGMITHLDNTKSVAFCNSCHIMENYKKSLYIDDPENIPAVHFQNNYVPQKKACYTCHTTYTTFGDLKIKIAGMLHVFTYYLNMYPEKIHMPEPYHNRECLHCHASARSFLDHEGHKPIMEKLSENKVYCLSCHSYKHDIENLDKHTFWKEPAK